MVDKTFELVVLGKTYTTLKVTPMLRGKLMQLVALVQKAADGYTQEEVNQTPWLQTAIAGALYENAPPVMWHFLKPADKLDLGVKDNLYDNIEPSAIAAFFEWAASAISETNSFLANSQVETTAQVSPSTPSSPHFQEDTVGVETTASL